MVLNPGLVVSGRYEVIEKIGSGGMAIVYRARDRKLDRDVTLKVMREELVSDEEFINRFNVEARSAGGLTNSNIVNVFDVGVQEPIHFIVMEYIDGVTLKDLIKKRAPFENDEILGVAIQIASGLEYAHKNNIVHRDIKPQNIMVTTSGNVKVTDFGIARAVTASTMTMTNSTMGSVHYFSPEQARGGFIDFKSDIYSLGIVMFEMATGKMPFNAETPITIALSHINDELPDIRELNPHISENVVQIITKATEKLSTNRYANIVEMLADLKRALTNSSEDYMYKYRMLEESATIKFTSEDIAAIKREVRASTFELPISTSSEQHLMEDEEFGSPDSDKATDRKVEIAAVLTALCIIGIISFFGFRMLFQTTEPNVVEPEQELQAVVLPDLVGKTFAAVQTEVTDLGISINLIQQHDDSVSDGDIISVDIGTDDEIYPGEEIDIYVSMGTNKRKLPDFVNRDIQEAYKILQELDYALKPREENIFDENAPQNVVIRQEPEADTLVKANSEVVLYVSRGKKIHMVTVPKVTGLTDAQAIEALQGVGLAVGHSVKAESSSVPEGQVIRQMTEAGTEVPVGSTVVYVLSLGPPAPSPVPTQTNVSKMLPVSLSYVPEGVTEVRVKILKVTAQGGAEEIMNETVDLSEFPLQYPVTGEGKADFQVHTMKDNGIWQYQGSTTIDFSNDETTVEEGDE